MSNIRDGTIARHPLVVEAAGHVFAVLGKHSREMGALVDGEIGSRDSATTVRRRGELAHLQIEPGGIRIVLVVPDGVARLTYSPPGMRSIPVGVHDNVAAFVIRPRPRAPGLVEQGATMVWFRADGSIIRRVPSMLASKPGRHLLACAADARRRGAGRV